MTNIGQVSLGKEGVSADPEKVQLFLNVDFIIQMNPAKTPSIKFQESPAFYTLTDDDVELTFMSTNEEVFDSIEDFMMGHHV